MRDRTILKKCNFKDICIRKEIIVKMYRVYLKYYNHQRPDIWRKPIAEICRKTIGDLSETNQRSVGNLSEICRKPIAEICRKKIGDLSETNRRSVGN